MPHLLQPPAKAQMSPIGEPHQVPSLERTCFYFDLSNEQANMLMLFKASLPQYGARVATFLDKSVTHFVTDKASAMVEAHSNTAKWPMTMWSLPQLVETLTGHMDRAKDPMIHMLKRMVNSRGRDLLECLEAEKYHKMEVTKKVARAAPLFTANAQGNSVAARAVPGGNTAAPAAHATKMPTTAAAGAKGSAQKTGKQAFFQAFTAPFVLVEEGDLYLAPIFKQYPPTSSGRLTFPVIKWEVQAPHCPFSYYTRVREDGKYWSDLQKGAVPGERTHHTQPTVSSKPKQLTKRASFGGDPARRGTFSPKPKPGYCECCFEKYEALRPHIQTEKHRAFAGTSENYASVDDALRHVLRTPLIDHFSYEECNPILAWSSCSVRAAAASHMSPAHSTILSQGPVKKVGPHGLSSLSRAFPTPVFENKENDSPSGLDLTGLDKDYLADKRRILSSSQPVDNRMKAIMLDSQQDVFQEPKAKARRLARLL